MMHPVANEVDISTQKIEEVFCQKAVPGFTGSVTAHIRVLPTAAQEIEFRFETNKVLQIEKNSDPETPNVTNARVYSVRRAIAENAQLFRLGTKITGVVAHFKDGTLLKLNAIEVE
jgi:hypothetical protein